MGRISKETQDVARASENVTALRTQLAGLESQMEADLQSVTADWDLSNEPFDRVLVKPKRGGVSVQLVALVWVPAPVLSERRVVAPTLRRESNG